jgi:hypothetical protein
MEEIPSVIHARPARHRLTWGPALQRRAKHALPEVSPLQSPVLARTVPSIPSALPQELLMHPFAPRARRIRLPTLVRTTFWIARARIDSSAHTTCSLCWTHQLPCKSPAGRHFRLAPYYWIFHTSNVKTYKRWYGEANARTFDVALYLHSSLWLLCALHNYSRLQIPRMHPASLGGKFLRVQLCHGSD